MEQLKKREDHLRKEEDQRNGDLLREREDLEQINGVIEEEDLKKEVNHQEREVRGQIIREEIIIEQKEEGV